MDDPFKTPEDGLTAVVTPQKRPAKQTSRRGVPKYNVILWDSEDHTADYVDRMLKELFGHAEPDRVKMITTVDTAGRVVVLTTTKEHAELKRDQIQAYGKDDGVKGCKGSMSSSIESAE
jgi:ATP-dependent Clp protease adaptor protein ClpS